MLPGFVVAVGGLFAVTVPEQEGRRHMPERPVKPPQLEYATPGLGRPAADAVDGLIVLLATGQAALGTLYIVALMTLRPRVERDAGYVTLTFVMGTYVGLSAVALGGAVRPDPARRRRPYRVYLIGLPVLATAATIAASVATGNFDHDLCWQLFVIAGIADPAWLLLLFRGLAKR